MIERIQAKIEQFIIERDKLQVQAKQYLDAHNNAVQGISAYNGAIEALQQLLSEEEKDGQNSNHHSVDADPKPRRKSKAV